MTTTLALTADVLAEEIDRASAAGLLLTRDLRDIVIDHKGDGIIRATLYGSDEDGDAVEIDARRFRIVEVED